MKDIIIKKPLQKRSKAKFSAILDACPRVLDEFGYRKTTTAKIALEADVSIGSFYDYFSCKEAVLIAYLDEQLKQAMIEVENNARRPGLAAEQSLALLVSSGIHFAEQQQKIIRVVFYEFPQQLSFIQLEQSRDKIFEIAAHFFKQHQKNISLKNKNPELLIYSLTNIVLGFQLRIALMENDEKKFSKTEIIHELTGIISAYLFD